MPFIAYFPFNQVSIVGSKANFAVLRRAFYCKHKYVLGPNWKLVSSSGVVYLCRDVILVKANIPYFEEESNSTN